MPIEEAFIPEVLVDPNIAMIEEFDIAGEDDEAIQKPPRRKQLNRPKNWEVIAEFYGQWGKRAAMRQFEDQLSDRSYRSIEQALVVWLEDFRAKKHNGNVGLKAPSYGNKIDLLLLVDVKARMLAGLPVDDASLRFLLVPILQANDLSDLLIENGGKFLYQHGWAARFWKRHNLVSRVVTTKMRIIPANFDEMEEKYISGLVKLVHRYKIPPDLVYRQDETNAQFVSRPNKTRADKGAKRVRSLGVGYEKPQITVTFTLKETGDVVGMHQLIFGGKTVKCEPKIAARCEL